MHGLAQLVQPATDRPIQQILFGPLHRWRVAQCLEQHGGRVLAVPTDGTAASTRDDDRIGIVDLDKDMIGARPRAPDGGDQALPAFVRTQVTNRTFTMIETALLETTGEATSDIALIKGD